MKIATMCEADACGAVATTRCHAGNRGNDYCDEHAAELQAVLTPARRSALDRAGRGGLTMGMHEPGWREKNEERAWEGWRSEMYGLRADLAGAAAHLDNAIGQHDSDKIIAALQQIDGISEAIFARRHGPENPSHA